MAARDLFGRSPINGLQLDAEKLGEVTTVSWNAEYGRIMPRMACGPVAFFTYHVSHFGQLEWQPEIQAAEEPPPAGHDEPHCESLKVLPTPPTYLAHSDYDGSGVSNAPLGQSSTPTLAEGECSLVVSLVKEQDNEGDTAATFTLFDASGRSKVLHTLPKRRGLLLPQRWAVLLVSPVLDITTFSAFVLWELGRVAGVDW